MLRTSRSYRGMVVAPHHLAAEAGLRVLREGGNAVEAMIAAASTIAVVYPHMNGLGGDNFWLIHAAGTSVTGIDACGAAAAMASPDFYKEQGLDDIPDRGPLAALTCAGAVSGWAQAYAYSQQRLAGKLPLSRLLEDAIAYAETGVAVTRTLSENITGKRSQLEQQPGFADLYLPNGSPLAIGQQLLQPRIADTLRQLVHAGFDDFYRGDLADSIGHDLETLGSPIRRTDLFDHQALMPEPLMLDIGRHRVYNMPPPTQGVASLMLLGVYERIGAAAPNGFDYVHSIVESSKAAFRIRDSEVSDPAWMQKDAREFLQPVFLDQLAATIDRKVAAPWPHVAADGDTVWLGAIDGDGNAVSFIQSVFWEFGSGVVLPQTGITWQNRGTSFSLSDTHHNTLAPGRRPFHTIQPAMAELEDGSTMVYGTMGGEGQPQTQAMLFSRIAMHGESVQQAVSAPRWLLGKTWGSDVTNLRIENRFDESVYQALRSAGHDLEVIDEYDEVMGHAGAIVRSVDGLMSGGADPRSNGAVCCY